MHAEPDVLDVSCELRKQDQVTLRKAHAGRHIQRCCCCCCYA